MNLSKDEARIINTVVSGLLPVRGQAACAEQMLQTIVGYMDARFDQATAQAEAEAALRAVGLPVHFERVRLCVEIASRLAGGYRDWTREQNSSALWDFPAWELVKSYPCAEPVNWAETWRQHGGRLLPQGRMIARKADAIWQAMSAFGLPFPPFDLGSGMGWREIPRQEAMELGIIDRNEVSAQEEHTLNEGVRILKSRAANAKEGDGELAGLAAVDGVRIPPVSLDFGDAFQRRVAFYFSPEGRGERLAIALIQASSVELLGLAEERVRRTGEMPSQTAVEIIALLERASQRGFGEDVQQQAAACGMLVKAYNQIGQSARASAQRFKHLELLKAGIEKRIPIDGNQRSIACGQVATIYEELGEPGRAAVYRQLQAETQDGFTLLKEAGEQLKSLGKQIGQETGARILEMLTLAAKRIPQEYPERHAEIYRATGAILQALGDTAQAIEYYEYALQKEREGGVKRRPETLRKSASGERS